MGGVSLKWKIWAASQTLLVVTAVIIQVVFHREIRFGPLLGTPKRPYADVILNVEPETPPKFLSEGVDPKLYDARLPMTKQEAVSRGLAGHRLSFRQEQGLRLAFWGGIIVNLLYFLAFHLGCFYFGREVARARRVERELSKSAREI